MKYTFLNIGKLFVHDHFLKFLPSLPPPPFWFSRVGLDFWLPNAIILDPDQFLVPVAGEIPAIYCIALSSLGEF